ncbi:TPA: hypothetical protein N0F65_005784 [Lagenidium giganteum]|uniref:F-box domain-containing protein n=1 Tax=Lagenidium giganteum TaxID=4803 RepID=A0AAV2YTR1_9STRA|nr:TPA: hypothetical protein N0F65_005784 [Lagenidium giganteum]
MEIGARADHLLLDASRPLFQVPGVNEASSARMALHHRIKRDERDRASASGNPARREVELDTERDYQKSHMPQFNVLGEILLALAKIKPRHCACCTAGRKSVATPCTRTRTHRSRSHWLICLSIFGMIAAQLVLLLELPRRIHHVVGGCLLISSAGASYLLLCYVLYFCHGTMELGELLLDRANPMSWEKDKLRFFLEICCWVSSVLYSYTTFQSEVLSIVGGAATAMCLAFCSDFIAAYVRMLESRMNQPNRKREQVVWLKVVFSYVCVGYVITGLGQILHRFLRGQSHDLQTIGDMVFNYLLISLVGVSIIVASELLLLYEPTRNAGIALQSRIINARKNWEEHTLRSLMETSIVFGITVLSFHQLGDTQAALQIGTLSGVLLITMGDLASAQYNVLQRRQDELPAEHWIKLLPVVFVMSYFTLRVGSVILNLVHFPSPEAMFMVGFAAVCVFFQTILAVIDPRYVFYSMKKYGTLIADRLYVFAITMIALKVCHGLPGIVFSSVLSWFCVNFSRECWNAIETKENSKPKPRRSSVESNTTKPLATTHYSSQRHRARQTTFSVFAALARKRFDYAYTRVKWTYICIVLLSCVDLCSTLVILLKTKKLQLSLSQFSAGNVVFATGAGYITSSVHQQLRPEVLVRTGARHLKKKWSLFPLHTFVEAAVFLGVFIGTFAATSTVFSSLTLASLSGIVVSVGGHWLCSRLHLTIGERVRVRLTGTCALVFCLFLFTYASVLCFFSIYHYIDSIEAAFCMASLSGVVFLASSELFLLWQPTREAGLILQRRVTHAKDNWQREPLRSFLELFTWLGVIIGSFALYDDFLLALQLGTFSGIAATLCGEYFRSKRSRLLSWGSDMLVEADHTNPGKDPSQQSMNDRSRVLPAMLFFAYIGSGTFQWIFENMRRLEVTVLLATIAGIGFLCIADLLVMFKPTRWAGIILQDRFLHAKQNWVDHPVRSFVEFGCFLGVIYGSNAIYHDLFVAVQCGSLSGLLVTLIGEQVRSHAVVPPQQDSDVEQTKVLPLPVMSLLGLVGAIAFNIIYTHLRSIEVAFVVATMSGVAFVVLGDMFVIWKPTRKVGLILQERILYIRYNMKIHPVRTWTELALCAWSSYVSYTFLWPGDLLVAIQVGTTSGMMSCVCGELFIEYLQKVEENLIRGAKEKFKHCENNKGLLGMPYEVLFEIAHCLTPEELLVVRGTCHKVNDMLRAESARFWLHASLRRQIRDRTAQPQQRSRSHSNSFRTRSLVFEAITLVLPKVFWTRDPSHVLTSRTGISRALKWVYLNANWIRQQNLPPHPRSEKSNLTFSLGDVAFEVFRHLPDKEYLGILVERNADLTIERIIVPAPIYEQIQMDPFSFVAAETLLEVDLCAAQSTDSLGFPDPHVSTTKTLATFSCTGGLENCPDGKYGYHSAGGNLTLTILEMRNLPDLDGFGAAGGLTDAYLEASIGDNVRRSATISNSLNPSWPACQVKGCRGPTDVLRDLNFGFRPAGTPILVRVMDEDAGFEFADDLIAEVTLNAIYCSAFTAKPQKILSDDDSVWKMPTQPLCVEEMWIPLSDKGACIDSSGNFSATIPCMRVRMTALPFQMRVEQVYLPNVTVSGGMAGYYPDKEGKENLVYGRVYSTSNIRLLPYYLMARSDGGMLVRSDSTTNNNKGNASLISVYGYTPYARFTINFDAEMYVFRRKDDAESQPEWLNSTFGWQDLRVSAELEGDIMFTAVTKNITAHAINQYGDAFKQGVITGANLRQDSIDTFGMYFIILVPHESFDVVPAVYSKDFNITKFWNVSLQFGFVFILLMYWMIKFLRQMNWRLERVQSYLAEKVTEEEPILPTKSSAQQPQPSKTTTAPGTNKTSKVDKHDAVAMLFYCYKQTPENIEFRRNLFYATWVIYLLLAWPLVLLVCWGITCIFVVTPPAFGFFLIFIGLGVLFTTYGGIRWIQMGWRMTDIILGLFGVSFLFAFVFLVSSTFADPRVFVGGEKLDFFALTSVFLALNMVPMIWIAFTNDSKLTASLSQVMSTVSANKKTNALKSKFKNLGSLGLKLANARQDQAPQSHQSGRPKRSTRKESAFAPVMGDHYTVEATIPGFNRADILQSAFVTPKETRRRKTRKYYGVALGILAVYCLVAMVRTDYPTQAIGISVTVMLVDMCIYMMYRGFLSWSAGYIAFIMGSVRVCLAATCGRYWILGHAFLYMVFGTALCIEIIGKNLPRMSNHEAGGVTFFGHDHQQWRHFDMSTTPEFVLGFVSFFYIFLLLAVAFGTDANQTITVPILGQQWPLWVFGVLAFIVVLFTGLALATSRAFFLQKEQLLSDYAMQVYLFVRPFRLPFMLAAASEVLVICSGLFVFASTKSTFILVSSVFAPLIMMLSLAVYVQWRRNDHRLVIWPPLEEEEDFLDDDEELDDEAAMEKEAEVMRETFVLPPLKGKGNTAIYDGGEETFKMPALPAKGALQAKLAARAKAPQAPAQTTKNAVASAIGRVGLKNRKIAGSAKTDGPSEATQTTSALPNLILTVTEENDKSDPSGAGSPSRPDKQWCGILRDFFVCRVGWRELCSRKAWRKYQKGSSKSLLGESPPGSPTPLLSGSSKKSFSSDIPDVDFAKMSLYEAFRQGYLLPQDYMTVGCFVALLVLVLLYGLILSATEQPGWIGHLIWVAVYVLAFTIFPTYKYFRIASITPDMKYAFGASYLLAWISGIVLFAAVLKCDVNHVESLVILTFLIMYPVFLLFIVTLFKWKDEEWKVTRPMRRTFAVCLGFIVIWIFEMYIFATVAFGGILTFLLLLFLFITYFLVRWVENDKYLSPRDQMIANAIITVATALAIGLGLFIGLNFFFCLSMVFVVLILKYCVHFVASWLVAKEEVQMFYSPYLFPAFSYNAYTNNVVDENQTVKYLYVLFLLCFMWGITGVMFFDPVGFGIGLCSIVLLVFSCVTAHLCAVTPVQMGIAAKYVNEMILKDASVAAKDVFESRRKPFVIECPEFVNLARREKKAELEFQAIAYGGAFKKKKKLLSGMDDDDDDDPKKKKDDEPATPPPRRTSGDIALEIHDLQRSFRFDHVDGVDVPLKDGLLTLDDIKKEVFVLGTGPLGFLILLTLPMRLLRYLRMRYFPSKAQRVQALAQAEEVAEEEQLDSLEANGFPARIPKKKNKVDEAPPMSDLVGMLMELPVLDEELDREFFEETRCVIHFQLLMLNAAEARLSREKILFQKFLRENRFKLMSNGINPPANIFKTSSFASIDIPLVAVWLISLTPEERSRFHALKAAFNEEMERTDAIVDAEDAQSRASQQALREYWRPHEEAQCRRRLQEFYARRMRREAEGILPEEVANQDEAVMNAQEAIMEIESGYSCLPGEYGRSLQFVDKEFPPDRSSIANCSSEAEIVGWKVSTAINIVAGLFDGGTDPDDVVVGKLNDSWLLSAISIMAASGGIDDGKVDALIDKIFITKQTSLTGAYALRIYKNCQWETVVVDDYFPVLDDSYRTSASAGAAFAHSKDFEELWVPLLEKAFAKYYGGYAALEQGYVHHALKDLTGYESEEIFLAQASRGSLKKTLWKQMLIYKSNKFLMGAGTITSENADTAILDTGLVFGACYVIYDVREIDGYQLLLLRNPPGDHAEWKGDWSDHSRLWTRRLKKLLKWNPDNDDNTFWMNFDDFCHAFRSLYICRYYDPAKWPVQVAHGRWQGDTACGLPTVHNPDCILENNPQYSLGIQRPTEVMISVTQVDAAGLAPADVLPIAVYVVAHPNAKDRALRVKKLEKETVVAHSGEPVRQREINIHCELEARTYTILVAAYKKGMEGPYKIRIQTNYPIMLSQIWPAAWKDSSIKGTVAEKVAAKVLESSAMGKILNAKNEVMTKLQAGAAVMDSVMKDETTVLKEQLEQEEKEQEAARLRASGKKEEKPKHVWIEQWDENAGKPFYFNKQTGQSSWDKPPDF